MARSLTVKHTEAPGTSSLLNAFLLVAFGWLVASMLFGSDKRSAAEFSFFLAMPTMVGAFAYDLFKNYHLMTADSMTVVAVGFVTAFFAALLVVKSLLDYVSNRGFALFAWWRVIVGTLGLIGLALGF